ncbi:cupin domain-containing protein [Phanerochaete sordida]|uniref:Cupin domain-containing protein n=1 Tax=Phanerochaete sordida TaxID=48140 RepID=A0A9P3G4R9_9APHY|nr:cupin domain-containing protein [Phanerochaete sordida]
MFTDLFWQEGFPANNDQDFAEQVKTHDSEVVNVKGTLLRSVEFAPHTGSFFHRTISLDYGILIHGALTLVLDDNKRVLLKPGDVVVQRGTIHAWMNETDEWTRMYCVMLPADKVTVGEKELESEFKPIPADWKASHV